MAGQERAIQAIIKHHSVIPGRAAERREGNDLVDGSPGRVSATTLRRCCGVM